MSFFKNLFKKKKEEAKEVDAPVEIVEDIPVVEEIVDNTIPMINLAIEKDATILAGNQSRINFLRITNGEAKVLGFAKNFTKNVAEGDFPNGVVIDISIDEEMIEYLRVNFPHIKVLEV